MVIFLVAFWRAKAELQARRQMSKLQEQTAYLSEQLDEFQNTVLSVVAVERPIGKEIRRRFLPGGDWCIAASKEGDKDRRPNGLATKTKDENTLCLTAIFFCFLLVCFFLLKMWLPRRRISS